VPSTRSDSDSPTTAANAISCAYPTLQTPRNNVVISQRTGWGKDYADAVTFFEPLMHSKVPTIVSPFQSGSQASPMLSLLGPP